MITKKLIERIFDEAYTYKLKGHTYSGVKDILTINQVNKIKDRLIEFADGD